MPDDPPPAPGDSPFPTLFPLPLPPPPSPPTPNHHIPARTDERCLTYCTQASNARVFQSPPTCHTLCWRRIWAYERSLIQAASTRAPLALTVPAPVQVGRGEEARELHSRFGRERERLQAMARAEQLASVPGKEAQQGEQPRLKSPLGPFPPSPSDPGSWSLLRGNYLYYASGPRRAARHMGSMHHLGLSEDWESRGPARARAAPLPAQGEAIRAEAREREKRRRERAGRAVGLRELEAGEESGEESEKERWDPDYAILISLEHIPPSLRSSLSSTIARISTPLSATLEKCRESFVSGQQRRTLGMLWEKLWDGEAGPGGLVRRWGEEVSRERREREKDKEREKTGKGGKGTGL